ncbi:MAG: SRPBCC domain-containing protein [Bacteroidetes bacterium]|nr:SRPBCC domain-containing protein [Bacteroidota bacterium]
MEYKTNVTAEEGKQEIFITREFDLPVDLLFRAYTDATIIEQWMGTKVLKLENHNQGGFLFETTDPKGNQYHFNGTIHAIATPQKIIRTFEFENMPFGVQLECLTFTAINEDSSKLVIHSIYESVAQRDQMLQLPFTQGINMAHNRLQQIAGQLK